jgi:hypothetical protein
MENPTQNPVSGLKAEQPGEDVLTQTTHNDAFAFSEKEQMILDLYDREQELQLEIALLEAQGMLESWCHKIDHS